jgi:hypothetical protein
MGSFNVACSVSHMSISPGMPIAYIPLEPNRFVPKIEENPIRFMIYPGDFYIPATLPIFGEYGDYGQIANIEESDNIGIILE